MKTFKQFLFEVRDPKETHKHLMALANDKSIAGTPEAHLAKQRADEFAAKHSIKSEPEVSKPASAPIHQTDVSNAIADSHLKKNGWIRTTPTGSDKKYDGSTHYIHQKFPKDRIIVHSNGVFTHMQDSQHKYSGTVSEFRNYLQRNFKAK